MTYFEAMQDKAGDILGEWFKNYMCVAETFPNVGHCLAVNRPNLTCESCWNLICDEDEMIELEELSQ